MDLRDSIPKGEGVVSETELTESFLRDEYGFQIPMSPLSISLYCTYTSIRDSNIRQAG